MLRTSADEGVVTESTAEPLGRQESASEVVESQGSSGQPAAQAEEPLEVPKQESESKT